MLVETLDELKSTFEQWRSKKRHARDFMPEQLLTRARQATKVHAVPAAVHATRVERSRLFRVRHTRTKDPQPMANSVVAYSRLELSAPSAPSDPLSRKVKTGSGVTLRVFERTPERMGLLTAMCGVGGVR